MDTVKAIVVMKRRSGTSIEDFRHALAGTEAAAAEVPGIRRYVRSLTLDSGYRKREPIYDAVDELWFDDETAARDALASEQFGGLRESSGADPSSWGVFLVTDHLAKDGPISPDGVKSFEFVTRRPDLSVAEFQRYWREVHGPLAVKIDVLRHYVQSHALASEYADGATPVWEGSAITWFDDLDAMRVSGSSAELARTRADEKNFLGAPLELPFIIVTERELVG
jgi:uncharacterized protein (TIGR02118 family)